MAAVWFQMVLGPVELVDEIDSTNAELLRRARSGAGEGVVLRARHQTAGRGRLNRSWEDEPDAALLVSVLLRPRLPADRLHLVTFAAGLAAVASCRAVAGVAVSLKWPNDVVDDRPDGAGKLAGLLAETIVEKGLISALVVGMGLNVRSSRVLPAGGVSLEYLAGHDVDAGHLLAGWLHELDRRYGALATRRGGSDVLEEYRAACSTLGRPVRVELRDETIEGVAEDVEESGHLIVRCPQRRAFSVGDVVHLRTFQEGPDRGTLD